MRWILLLTLILPVASGCMGHAKQTKTQMAHCSESDNPRTWSQRSAWFAEGDAPGRCQMSSDDTKTAWIIAGVAGGIAVLVAVPIIIWAATRTNTGGGGGSGGCPKCKVTKTRSDGVVQSYWVCC